MNVARVVVGGGLALAALALLGVSTRLAYRAEPADAAEVRLSWRMRVPRVEECRRLTAEEIEALPVHMRRDEVCEGRVVSYHLEVALDGRPVHAALVEGAGARGDRPLFVFRNLRVEPGVHELRVVFERPAGSEPYGANGAQTAPGRLVLERRVELAPREVVLVTYDAQRRELTLMEREPL